MESPQVQRTSVTGSSVPNVPYPSLAAEYYPELREMDAFLTATLADVERLAVWSTAEVNHEPLIHSVAEVKSKVVEWRRHLITGLQGKWMAAAAEYAAYKQQVDAVLRKRHCSEIQFLFPSLKTAERESQLDPTTAMMMSEDERSVRAHLSSLGFGYDKALEGAARRVSKLAKRQEKERALFDSTVHLHTDQLAYAKKADVAKLQRELERSEQLLQAIVSAVEGKMAAASSMQAATLYHRNSPRNAVRSPPRSARPPTSGGPSGASHGAPLFHRVTGSARSDRSNTTQLHRFSPSVAAGDHRGDK